MGAPLGTDAALVTGSIARTRRSALEEEHMRRSLFKSPVGAARDSRPRFTKRKIGAAITGGVASLATVGAIVASAAVPEAPNNLVVFPDRDFVTVEGYQDHIGEIG